MSCFLPDTACCFGGTTVDFSYTPPLSLQPLGFENSQAVIVPLFFLVSINLLFNNWAKDQVGIYL